MRPQNFRNARRVVRRLHRGHQDQHEENGIGQARIRHEPLFPSEYALRFPRASSACRIVLKPCLSGKRPGAPLPAALTRRAYYNENSMKSKQRPPAIVLVLLLGAAVYARRSEEHTSELQSHLNLVCRLL